jgi:phosphoribosyl 1,2-cyclic phosphodiesterase
MFALKYIATGSKGNCCFLTDGETNLIIDLGITLDDFKSGMESIDQKVRSLDGIFITHEHGDHISGAKKVVEKYQIPSFLSKGTFDNSNMITLNQYLVNQLVPGKKTRIKSLEIMPFIVDHDVAEPIGFLFRNQLGEKLVFVADCGSFDFKIDADFYAVELNYMKDVIEYRNAEGKMHEALYKRISGDYGHVEMQQTIDFALEHPNAEYVFHHLSYTNIDHHELENKLDEHKLKYHLASPGLEVQFGEVEPY